MATELQLETLVSELLIHAGEFLGPGKTEVWESDPLLYSIVSGFLANLAIYQDYREFREKLNPNRSPFEFSKEIPT